MIAAVTPRHVVQPLDPEARKFLWSLRARKGFALFSAFEHRAYARRMASRAAEAGYVVIARHPGGEAVHLTDAGNAYLDALMRAE